MSSALFQILVFGIFIAFLVVGFLYKKDPRTIKEYALGNRKFSTFALICTMVATTFGASAIVGRAASLYQNGLWLFLALCAMPVGDCITSLIIPKLSKYYGCTSVAEIMSKMYGTHARRLVGVFAFIYCLGMLGAQIKVLQWIMEQVFIKHALIATMIGTFIITLYSSMGGVFSFIRADIIHFFIFIVIMPVVATCIFRKAGGITTITNYFHESSSRAFFHGGSVTSFLSLTLLYILPNLGPMFFHRFLMGRDCKKNQAASYTVAFVSLANLLFVGCIAFIALAKFPSIEPQDTTFAVVQSFITNEWGIMLFTLVLISMVISVSKSSLTTGAILVVNDVFAKKLSEEQKMKWLKVATIASTAIALSFVYFFSNFSNLFNILLVCAEYYWVIVTVPLIVGFFIKETRREPFWISASAGFFTFTSLHLAYRNLSHEIFLTSSIASLISYLATAFIIKKGKIQNAFSFRKLCDDVVVKYAVQAFRLGWITLLIFMASIIYIIVSDRNDPITIAIETTIGALGFLLLGSEIFSAKYRSTIVLVAIWYCLAFTPAYLFLHQKAGAFFTINLIISAILLVWQFNWNVFLTFLLSGSSMAVIAFGIFSHGFQDALAPLMYLFLAIGAIATITYIAFRKEGQAIAESVRNQLKAEKERDQEKREAAMYTKIMQAINTSLDADYKYKNDLLNQATTIEVLFKELRDNILSFFQKTSIERKTKLIVVNSQHKILSTGFPTGIFYKLIYSLIFNVFYSNDTEDIRVKFGCDKNGRLRKIEISHGQYKINDRAKYLKGSYPDDILEWNIIKSLFEQLEIRITEGLKTLKIVFPSEATPIESKVISFKDLRVRAAQEPVN